jgi:asparagine synthase (glutamine-hydrolysing)
MCGIVGRFRSGGIADDGWLDAATDRLVHRGPDDRGTWQDPAAGIELGQRRLSIVDLSEAGHQPMHSASGRYVVVFNGEIYDHRDLRRRVEDAGARLRGTSDTEVLVEAIDRWGLRRALELANGMFAIAVWDRKARRLALARDRIGEKPLFVQEVDGEVRFTSELKAWWVGSVRPPAVDRSALASFLRYGYVPGPHAIFEGVTKLAPGTIRWFGEGAPADEVYWDLPPLGHGEAGAAQHHELAGLIEDSVALRMVADVPVGAFLSGGIDSSLVAALMAATGGTVRTFTIGFDDGAYDESIHARRIADHLGTEHTEMRVTPDDALDLVPSLPAMFDEPFADSSAIPTALVAQLTRQHVTVALSGDGGDELFGGYGRYRRLRMSSPAALVPRAGGPALGAVARRLEPVGRLAGSARTLERVAAGIEAGGSRGLYRSLLSHWDDPALLVHEPELTGVPGGPRRWPVGRDLVRTAMGADLLAYLPDDILVKVDRTSMAVGLEARVPLLDHRIIEWSRRWARPSVAAEDQMKAPLRDLLARHVPRELWERPKQGFGAPVDEWLRGALRPWAEDLLAPAALARTGIEAAPVRAVWAEHLSGQADRAWPLWTVLTYQAWHATWVG